MSSTTEKNERKKKRDDVKNLHVLIRVAWACEVTLSYGQRRKGRGIVQWIEKGYEETCAEGQQSKRHFSNEELASPIL